MNLRKIIFTCLTLLSLTACNLTRKFDRYYNNISYSKRDNYTDIKVANRFNNDSIGKIITGVLGGIKKSVYNQYFMDYNFKKIDSIYNLMVNAKTFLPKRKIGSKGHTYIDYVMLNNGNYTFNYVCPYLNFNYSNLHIELENVTACCFKNDSFITTGATLNSRRVKLIIYKVSNISFVNLYNNEADRLQKELITFNNIYFAFSELASTLNVSNSDLEYSAIFPLSPKIINYELTLKNLARNFDSHDKKNPRSYIPFLRMAICGKYSDRVLTALCNPIDSNLSKFHDLTYLKSKGTKFHYYAFYSEIYKKDMRVRLDTKHPEKIKVTTYKP
jgi:hypothetical protein